MKIKQIIALSIMAIGLISCQKEAPPAPFGLQWNYSEKDINDLIEKNILELTRSEPDKGLYQLKSVPKPDFEHIGEIDEFERIAYMVVAKGSLKYISVLYFDLNTEESEKLVNFYKNKLSAEYGNSEDLKESLISQKNCIEKNVCTKLNLKYEKNGVFVVLNQKNMKSAIPEGRNFVQVSFSDQDEFEKNYK